MTMTATAEALKNPHPYPIGTVDEVISEVSSLVSPPSVCVKLYNLINSSQASASDIGNTLELDPNLVARVLKIVNSAAYSFPSQISTVSRAVTILGTQDLCNIVMAIAAVRSFSKMDGGLYSLKDFWHHSVYIGLASRHIAAKCGIRDAEAYFIAGLLHDVGIPVIYGSRPELAEQMKPYLQQNKQALVHAEKQHLGFDHATIAGKLLASWCLPPLLIDAISHHYGPYQQAAAAILRLADVCETVNQLPITQQSIDDELQKLPPDIWQAIGKSPDQLALDNIIDKVNQEHVEVLKALID